MLNYGDLETEVALKLNNYFTTNSIDTLYEAVVIPENENEIQIALSKSVTKTVILVQHLDSQYAEPKSINHVSQAEGVIVRLIFLSPNLRGSNGIYTGVMHGKLCLLGYIPQNCSQRFFVTKYSLDDFVQFGVRNFLDFKTDTVAVQMEEDETVFGLQFKGASYPEPD